MRVQVRRWGNSLALRIPRAYAEEVRATEGTTVDLSVSAGKLVARPLRKGRASLRQLLRRVTPDNLHGEVDTGPSVGREAW